jgi:hypothetical protein
VCRCTAVQYRARIEWCVAVQLYSTGLGLSGVCSRVAVQLYSTWLGLSGV